VTASHVLVIGASSIDIKGRPGQSLLPQTSTPGDVRLSVGGVARNVAENLARLDTKVILLSAVGNDHFGHTILEQTARAGVDVSHVVRSDHIHSGAYLALLDEQGRLAYSIDDMAIMETLTPRTIYARRALFKGAGIVFLDGNVPPQTIASVIKAARSARVPVAVDPTSVALAPRYTPYLADISLMTPNLNEAEVFCERTIKGRRSAINAARHLVSLGVETAIITLGPDGLAYATAEARGWVPAIHKDIVDLTGAADALTAGVIFGQLNGLPLDESVRLGVSAAALTYQSVETVRPDLSLELLYEQL
jgi:pseudouridine kinase